MALFSLSWWNQENHTFFIGSIGVFSSPYVIKYNFPICLVHFSVWEREELRVVFSFFSPPLKRHSSARITHSIGCICLIVSLHDYLLLCWQETLQCLTFFSRSLFRLPALLATLSSISHRFSSRSHHECQPRTTTTMNKKNANKHITKYFARIPAEKKISFFCIHIIDEISLVFLWKMMLWMRFIKHKENVCVRVSSMKMYIRRMCVENEL